MTKRGRWRTNRCRIPYVTPYENHATHAAKSDTACLSYEIQSSWAGLVATVGVGQCRAAVCLCGGCSP